MAEEKGEGGDARRDFFTFLFILAVLGFAWFETGGPTRSSSQGAFLNPPPPLGTGGSYGLSFLDRIVTGREAIVPSPSTGSSLYPGQTIQFEQEIQALMDAKNASPYKGRVYFSNTWQGTSVTDADSEFVTIESAPGNSEKINVTGWALKSAVTNTQARIGTGASFFYSGRENGTEAILLAPGELAVIVTGRSPSGSSFRVNRCSGYLGQFQNYTPQLSKNCPLPFDEVGFAKPGTALNDACLDYIKNLDQCSAPVATPPPSNLPSSCVSFIADTFNYNSCVDHHRSDSDFWSNEWRIYLARNAPLWKQQRETIELLDEEGRVVDLYSFGY